MSKKANLKLFHMRYSFIGNLKYISNLFCGLAEKNPIEFYFIKHTM